MFGVLFRVLSDSRLGRWGSCVVAAACGCGTHAEEPRHSKEIPQLVSVAKVPGDAQDLSGLEGRFSDGTAKNQLGGFSAIASTSTPGRYYVLPDRGPSDGQFDYPCRFHEVEISFGGVGKPSEVRFLATRMLTAAGSPLTGLAAAFEELPEGPRGGRRLDPEGLRVLGDGNLLISDEYGPHLMLFSPAGELLRQFEVPEAFRIRNPGLTKQEENAKNNRGRRGNAGLEGLALSPDGKRAYAMLQGPLLQDHAFDAAGKEAGMFLRILEMDLVGNHQRQLAYRLENRKLGISALLADDDGTLLVLERDSEPGDESLCKKIFRIDLREASDISSLEALSAEHLPAGVRAVRKEPFLDLLDPAYGLVATIPEKLEGLAWGPRFPSGERCLIVSSDNDFKVAQASLFYFFACPAAEPR